MLLFFLAALETEEERRKMTELHEENKRLLKYIAFEITKNNEMAEDAVQNTFWAAIRHKEKILDLSCRDFRNWSVITVRRKCYDLMRKEAPISDTPLDEMENILPSDDEPIDIQVIRRAEYARMRKYISELDDPVGQIVEMKYILQMSYKEIGAEFGMTPKHVETTVYRAKRKVRKLMMESEEHTHE